MKIVIAGAGEMGSHLAKMLSGNGHDITSYDSDPKLLADVASLADVHDGRGRLHDLCRVADGFGANVRPVHQLSITVDERQRGGSGVGQAARGQEIHRPDRQQPNTGAQ